METDAVKTSTKGKEIRIPGPDHPIAILPAGGKVRITVARKIVAATRALRLEEKGYSPVYYFPRSDADMSLLVRTTHYTYCPCKGQIGIGKSMRCLTSSARFINCAEQNTSKVDG